MRGIQAVAAQEGTAFGRAAREGLILGEQGEQLGCGPGEATSGRLEFGVTNHGRLVRGYQEPLSALCTQNSGSDLSHASLAQRVCPYVSYVLAAIQLPNAQ